jgi:hypothetical protein
MFPRPFLTILLGGQFEPAERGGIFPGFHTEFQVQGLELDWICVIWDGNFRYGKND